MAIRGKHKFSGRAASTQSVVSQSYLDLDCIGLLGQLSLTVHLGSLGVIALLAPLTGCLEGRGSQSYMVFTYTSQ